MEKIDLKKRWRAFYAPSASEISVVDIPAFRYLMIDGKGDPNSSRDYSEAVEALFRVSYTAKFSLKKQGTIDYGVMPLEGLWWSDSMEDFRAGKKDEWCWTMMVMQPECVAESIVNEAIESVRKKKKLPVLSGIRYNLLCEGQSAQILYRGPYKDETETIARLHAFISERGGSLSGKHHEIYLNDPRRTAPEKLKTIIRQPFH
jgi:hypothetical protein